MLSTPATVVAAVFGLVVKVVVGVSVSADPRSGDGAVGTPVGMAGATALPAVRGDPLAEELAAQARAVSDPASQRYRRFEMPAQVAKYLGQGAPAPDAAPAGLPRQCSAYFGQLEADAYPTGFDVHPAVVAGAGTRLGVD